MPRIREPIVQIENATTGNRALVSIPVGRTWLDAHIEHGGLTLAQVTNIRVLLVSPQKTVTIQEFKDGTELNELNKRYGRKVVAGTLSFYFRRPELENEGQSLATAIGTGGLQAFRIEFDIAAATSPVITAWGRKTANRDVSVGIIPYISNFNLGGQVAGNMYFDGIEKRDRIAAVHVLNAAAGAVTTAKLKVDDAVVHDLTIARINFDEGEGGRVPYATSYGACIDFTTAGVLDEALICQSKDYQVQSMRLEYILGASPAATTRLLIEYLSTWASLTGALAAQKAA